MTSVIILSDCVKYLYVVKFLVVILGLLMLVRPVVPVLEYAINYDYISKVLCVNKQAPEKKCNGKCHLKKNLDEVFNEEKSDTTSGSTKTITLIETVVIDVITLPVFKFNAEEETHTNDGIAVYSNQYSYLFLTDFFHPPAHLV